jgi:hypothetical protein
VSNGPDWGKSSRPFGFRPATGAGDRRMVIGDRPRRGKNGKRNCGFVTSPHYS